MNSVFKLPLAIYLIGLALTLHVSLAQNSPQDYVHAHNEARAEVGCVPVTWNKTLADTARNRTIERINSCNLIEDIWGESIAEASYAITGVEGVKFWAKEKSYYDYGSNSCVGRNCFHYTQLVWNETTDIGCARAQCGIGFWFVSCLYYPQGNTPLERPYKRH